MILHRHYVRSLRNLVALTLYVMGVPRLALFLRRRLLRSYGVVVMSYHHVVTPAERPDRADETTTVQLAQHLRFLTKAFEVISLDEALDVLKRGPLTKDYAVITFDDGYEDNYREGLPILRRFGVPATIFLITGLIGTDCIPWYDEDAAGLSGGVRFRLLRWHQIREMVDLRISFGSHTIDHPNLTRLDGATVRAQLETSKQAVENATGRACYAFAFPNGDFDAAVVDAVREAGYRCACTQKFGSNGAGCDPFRLRRVALGDTPLPVLALKLSGAVAPLFAASEIWGRRRPALARIIGRSAPRGRPATVDARDAGVAL